MVKYIARMAKSVSPGAFDHYVRVDVRGRLRPICSINVLALLGACFPRLCRTALVKKTMKTLPKKPPRMTPDEKRIAREMHFDRGMPPVDVAKALGRGLSSVTRLLGQNEFVSEGVIKENVFFKAAGRHPAAQRRRTIEEHMKQSMKQL